MSDTLYYIILISILGLVISIDESPPIKAGIKVQYLLAEGGQKVKLKCSIEGGMFHSWQNLTLKSITDLLSESQTISVDTPRIDDAYQMYICKSVNGYGYAHILFIIRIIISSLYKNDPDKINCVRDTDVCFLKSSATKHLVYNINKETRVILDCRIVRRESNKHELPTWTKSIISSQLTSTRPVNYLQFNNYVIGQNLAITSSGEKLNEIAPVSPPITNSLGIISGWDSIVQLDVKNANYDGTYECRYSNDLVRYFTVKWTGGLDDLFVDGKAPKNITISAGSSIALECKVNNPSKQPSWGIQLKKDEAEITPNNPSFVKYDGHVYKILPGSSYRVLGPNDYRHLDSTQNNADLLKGVIVNYLNLTSVTSVDSRVYVCSAFNKNHQLKQKYYRLIVTNTGDGYPLNPNSANQNILKTPRKNPNFPLYISIPVVIFVLCLGSLICCYIYRQMMRRKGHIKNRAPGPPPLNHTATASSSNTGVGMLSGGSTGGPLVSGNVLPNNIYIQPTVSSGGIQYPHHPHHINANYHLSGGTPTTTTSQSGNSASYHSTGVRQPMLPPTTNSNSSGGGGGYYPTAPVPPQPTLYDSDSTPSPPPPTSVTDTVSSTHHMMYHPHHSLQHHHHHNNTTNSSSTNSHHSQPTTTGGVGGIGAPPPPPSSSSLTPNTSMYPSPQNNMFSA